MQRYTKKLKCLAVLAEITVEELKGKIDFWMTDRARDNTTMFENLGIDAQKVLKCCAHIILGVDHATDMDEYNIKYIWKNCRDRKGVPGQEGFNNKFL